MIDLVRKKEQLEIWTDKEAGLKSVFFKEGADWKRATPEQVYDLTLGDLFSGRVRLIAEMQVEDIKVYVTTTAEDEAGCRRKHPNSVVINLPQFMGLFRSQFTEGKAGYLSQAILTMAIFPGARIVS